MEIRHFLVDLCPQVVIGNDCGTIHITTGSTGYKVTIQTTTWNRRVWKASDGIWADYKQDGNTITAWVTQSNTSRVHNINYVDFDITVPSNTDLRLITKTGDIRVTGIKRSDAVRKRGWLDLGTTRYPPWNLPAYDERWRCQLP